MVDKRQPRILPFAFKPQKPTTPAAPVDRPRSGGLRIKATVRVERPDDPGDAPERPGILTRYNEFQGAVELGDWFILKKNGRQLRCVLHTHPLGWEIRLLGARDGLERTQVCRTELDVFNLAEDWEKALLSKGWA